MLALCTILMVLDLALGGASDEVTCPDVSSVDQKTELFNELVRARYKVKLNGSMSTVTDTMKDAILQTYLGNLAKVAKGFRVDGLNCNIKRCVLGIRTKKRPISEFVAEYLSALRKHKTGMRVHLASMRKVGCTCLSGNRFVCAFRRAARST
ncbi:unnamed protein product [Cylicocyclus nassatus]|uniref:Secreted protein n=1 Tax=Cylicocyclus nassatus TaxID=53992 RepID=A0AA36DRE8_CYLNA|nr:unnamed protein product [Cylicocyclus nassatus]